jgi:hypothetical protein
LNFDASRLWQPNTKDIVSGLYAQRFTYFATNSGLVALLSTDSTDVRLACPADKARVIVGASSLATPGAGQSSTFAYLNIWPPALGQTIVQIPLGQGFSASINNTSPWIVAPWIITYPGEIAQVFASFSAAGASNAANFSLWGYDIPRGNLQ